MKNNVKLTIKLVDILQKKGLLIINDTRKADYFIVRNQENLDLMKSVLKEPFNRKLILATDIDKN